MNIEIIDISELRTEGLQIRVALDKKTIAEYAELLNDGQELPPISVFKDKDGALYLADGFHRVAAERHNGCSTIAAEVRDGTYQDALRVALGANAAHGLRRTNADKQHAMEVAWANRYTLFPACVVGNIPREAGAPTSRQLASLCGVSFGNAVNFIKNKGGDQNDHLPPPDAPFDGDNADTRPDGEDTAADVPMATTVTSDHLEERNPNVRSKLKQGLDRFGMAIPERLMPAFLATQPRDQLRRVRQVRREIEKLELAGNVAYAAIGQRVLTHLDNAIGELKYGAPFCVCRRCRGDGCASCGKIGFMTILQYRRLPREWQGNEAREAAREAVATRRPPDGSPEPSGFDARRR